jgi:hypothetical protein
MLQSSWEKLKACGLACALAQLVQPAHPSSKGKGDMRGMPLSNKSAIYNDIRHLKLCIMGRTMAGIQPSAQPEGHRKRDMFQSS